MGASICDGPNEPSKIRSPYVPFSKLPSFCVNIEFLANSLSMRRTADPSARAEALGRDDKVNTKALVGMTKRIWMLRRIDPEDRCTHITASAHLD
jgi:hypothetical protein